MQMKSMPFMHNSNFPNFLEISELQTNSAWFPLNIDELSPKVMRWLWFNSTASFSLLFCATKTSTRPIRTCWQMLSDSGVGSLVKPPVNTNSEIMHIFSKYLVNDCEFCWIRKLISFLSFDPVNSFIIKRQDNWIQYDGLNAKKILGTNEAAFFKIFLL